MEWILGIQNLCNFGFFAFAFKKKKKKVFVVYIVQISAK